MPNSAASRLVLEPFSEETVTRTAQALLQEIGGRATLGFVFASIDYLPDLPDFLELIQLHGHVPTLVGCSGAGLIGTDCEGEQKTGFSLLLLNLPDTTLHVCEISQDHASEVELPEEWHEITGVKPGEVEAWIALADPFGFPAEPWLSAWNKAYPGIPTLGGLSSSNVEGTAGEEVFVIHDRKTLDPASAILVGFKGGVQIRGIVAQGCRPIGEPLTVTGTDGNLVLTLGGKPAYSALAEAFDSLSDDDKAHAQGNLFAGLASSEYIEEFRRGDFLIRTILGADANSGAVALGAYPRVGQTFQWQLRDAKSADADLGDRLAQERKNRTHSFATLVFSCNGRGRELFGEANHDAGAVARALGPIASAGLFCNGEIGPVGEQNFVHGYTVSIALFV